MGNMLLSVAGRRVKTEGGVINSCQFPSTFSVQALRVRDTDCFSHI